MSKHGKDSGLNAGTPDKCGACGCPRLRQHCSYNASSCTWAMCTACWNVTGVILGSLRWFQATPPKPFAPKT